MIKTIVSYGRGVTEYRIFGTVLERLWNRNVTHRIYMISVAIRECSTEAHSDSIIAAIKPISRFSVRLTAASFTRGAIGASSV